MSEARASHVGDRLRRTSRGATLAAGLILSLSACDAADTALAAASPQASASAEAAPGLSREQKMRLVFDELGRRAAGVAACIVTSPDVGGLASAETQGFSNHLGPDRIRQPADEKLPVKTYVSRSREGISHTNQYSTWLEHRASDEDTDYVVVDMAVAPHDAIWQGPTLDVNEVATGPAWSNSAVTGIQATQPRETDAYSMVRLEPDGSLTAWDRGSVEARAAEVGDLAAFAKTAAAVLGQSAIETGHPECMPTDLSTDLGLYMPSPESGLTEDVLESLLPTAASKA